MFPSKLSILALLAALFWGDTCPAAEATRTLTHAAEIRSLSREDAARGLPVKLRGTVVFKNRSGSAFIVHDGQEGVGVHMFRAMELGLWEGGKLRASENEVGAVIELEGVTRPAGYSPVVVPTRLRRIGTGPLPEPQRISTERLISGIDVSQRVLVEGVVQRSAAVADGRWMMTLMVDGHPCDVDFQQADGFDPLQMLDARVQVRGCFSPVFNLRSEFTQMRLNAMGKEDVTVIEPPPSDPFAGSPLPLKGLLTYSRVPNRFHRKMIAGIVNFAMPGQFFFIQDGTAGLRVDSSAAQVKVGERVEVAGFVQTTRGIASLSEAVVRHLGPAALPPPGVVSARELLQERVDPREPVVDFDYFGRLVRIRGQLRQVEWRGRDGLWSLLVESRNVLFRAQIPGPFANSAPPWKEGSEVEITGVCELELSPRRPGTNSPDVAGFNLWSRGPGDVSVVRFPPWWTAERLGVALLGAVCVLTLALGWNVALRRLLSKRSRLLEDVMLKHRNAELEFKGARHERQRLATDLHDGLQQLMAGAACRVQAAAAHLGKVPPAVDIQLKAALRALIRSQEGLRETLWGLQHMEEGPDDFAALLRHAVGTIEHWPQGALRVTCEGTPFPLSRHVMGSLLLLMQEMVGNAFKHGSARRVDVVLAYAAEFFELRIEDDGCGFDPDKVPGPKEGHFGLESARLRMKWLGGTAKIASSPGSGTRIICHLPKALATVAEKHLNGEDDGSEALKADRGTNIQPAS